MLALLPKLTKKSWVVLELSSFQLMDLKISPHIAVVLFVTRDHLDYHRDLSEYQAAKANIVKYQKGHDFAVLNADNRFSDSLAEKTPARIKYFSRIKKVSGTYIEDGGIYWQSKLIGKTKDLKLVGSHNWENVTAAITAAGLAAAPIGSIKKAVFDFKGLEHRLEKVRMVNGVVFYNDSFSTTPETTIAAIRSFRQPVILIAGGSQKGSDYTSLGREISRSTVKTVILIGETAPQIRQSVEEAGFWGRVIFQPGKMKKVVSLAAARANIGDVILLSPACASFDMFENYKQRGRLFKEYVKKI